MDDYVIQVHDSLTAAPPEAWDALLQAQACPTPFMQHAYLQALQASGSACAESGWNLRLFMVYRGEQWVAATVLYLKSHSMGEYVFDWAWASAYHQHGLDYYPKAVVAVPFTPVPGSKLLAADAPARVALVRGLLAYCDQQGLSSLHLLFISEEDRAAAVEAGLMLRHTVQFHWTQAAQPYGDFEVFLASLSQEKRKKIRQERRKVQQAGVVFRHAQGTAISLQDWQFFNQCYERTYFEHGNAPYLSPAFFAAMARDMPEHWVLFLAERDGRPIACSLVALGTDAPTGDGAAPKKVAYGRYWGALERVDCLHFEACYYQPIAWCIAHGYHRFEGGAQGEHKMARALLPVSTVSAHWIAHEGFRKVIAHFLQREAQGIDHYREELALRSPLKKTGAP